MKVLKDRVLISIDEAETAMKKTASGLTIPTSSLENGDLEKATVIEIGAGVENLEKGEKLFIYKGAGKEFTLDGTKYRVVSPADIVVVF